MAVTTAPARQSRRAGRASGRTGVRRYAPLTPYLFLLPFLILFCGFVLIPAIFGLWVSFHDYNYLLPGKPWVGLQNYIDLFTPGSRDSGDFWKSMEATGIFTVFSVPFLIICPLGVALLLNRVFPGRSFFRAVFFAPYVLGVAVVGILFRFVLDPNIGLVNYYLGHAIPWTTDLPWAWISLIGMTVWWTLGFNAIIYMAGLQEISPDLYEAARVDGASRWAEFRAVTLPGLRPVMAFVTTVTILASANMFGQSFLLTDGAPANETRTAIMYIAQTGFSNNRQGIAAAMSYILAVLLLAISVLNLRLTQQREGS
ncbi:carbohydrate ABC transporter permease [Paractinoplanes rhizophilus]|uniref:Carbohydrate ABC transporter permease n=1 Tax=Paractinoplanes rhizophilus TaxID=1416877 RepID=A0ABW2HK67_9ACTN|nr:sugar ABC transporter permease [Actinoplanes sp.]